MEMAVDRTGLDDLGHPARNEGLLPYAASVSEDTWESVTPIARELAVDYLVHQLCVRLRLMNDRKSFPEIDQESIKAALRAGVKVNVGESGSVVLRYMRVTLDDPRPVSSNAYVDPVLGTGQPFFAPPSTWYDQQ